MRKLALVGLLLLGAGALAGCWDRLEVNDLAIVTLVGIDQAAAGVRLTVNVVVPARAQMGPGGGGGGGGDNRERSTAVYSAEGETIMDALAKVQEQVSRRLFWAHARVLVFGAEYARAGVGPALDFWSRHREPRLLMQVAVTPGQALEFLQAQPELERLLSEAVREITNLRLQLVTTVKDFLIALRSPGEHPVAPRFELVPAVPGGPEREVRVTGTAVFRGDRLVGWLDDAETRGLLWLRDEMETGTVTVDVPGGGKVSLQLIRGKTVVRPEFDGHRLRLVVSIRTEDDIYESSVPLDFGKAETIRVIEGLLARDLRQRIRPVLDRVQREFRVDILKFGDAVRRGAPLLWEADLQERWAEEFPQVPVDLEITAHVRRTGEHSAPLGAKEKEIKARQKELMRGKGEGES